MTLDRLRPYCADLLRRPKLLIAFAATILMLALVPYWYLGSATTANGTAAPSSDVRVSYGSPKVLRSTTNVPGKFEIVMNRGETAISHNIHESFPLERDAVVSCVPRNVSCVFRRTAQPGVLEGKCSSDGLSCVLRRTVQTDVVMTVTDVSKCAESDLKDIVQRLNGTFPIVPGQSALEDHSCARHLESRSYAADA